MARLKSTEVSGNDFMVTFLVTKKEYKLLDHGHKHFLLLPLDGLQNQLTIGTLGNSYRVMLPKKFLKEYEISEEDLPKKADAGVFHVDEDKFLAVRIEESKLKTPRFGE